jgi:threonine/homoserine/homoserine lactone efflux protein
VIPLVGGGILGDFSAMTLPQLLILGSTFLSLAMIVASFYAIFAGQLRERMQHGSMRRLLNRCGGSALIGAGIFTAAMQRSS